MGTIRTARLALRTLMLDDVDAYLAYHSDPDTILWLGSQIAPERERTVASIAEMEALGGPTEGHWFRYAIDLNGELIGDVVCQIRDGGGIAEIGYVLHPAHRGHGYATEAGAALVDHLIDHHDVHRIEASLAPDNVASMRVLEAIGMTFEVLVRAAYCLDGVWEDDLRYAMTATDRSAWRGRDRNPPATVELVELAPADVHLWGRLETHYSQRRFTATMPLNWCDALFPAVVDGVASVPWMRGVLADGERVGFVMTSTTHGTKTGHDLRRMLIDRTHQRRGIGRRALTELFEVLRAEGVPRLYTSCGQGPGTPQPFFERLGFVPTAGTVDGTVDRTVDGTVELVNELS